MVDLGDFLGKVDGKREEKPSPSPVPSISVITPSFNQGAFLRGNILSVINQRYPFVEHVIIDGGSTDSTMSVLEEFGDRIAYWVSEPDRGQSDALNKGLARARGEIVGWQNSDDFYLPGALQLAGKIMRDNPHIDVLYGDYLYVDGENRVVGSKKYPPRFTIKEYLYVGANISNQSVFFRKSAIERAGGFDVDLHLAMDFDLFLRLASFAHFKHVRAYLGAYRVHGEQKGQTLTGENVVEYSMLRKRAGIAVNEKIPWKAQYRGRKMYYRTRRNLLKFLYYPLYMMDPLYRGIRD